MQAKVYRRNKRFTFNSKLHLVSPAADEITKLSKQQFELLRSVLYLTLQFSK